jgi:uncharacterized protein YjbI with pentapeptide repeats
MASYDWRRFAGSAALAVLLSVVSGAALACSCYVEGDPEARVAQASIMFAGSLERTDQCGEGLMGRCMVGTFRIHEAYKGPLGETVEIQYEQANGSNCGAGFRPNQTELIVAYGVKGAYRTSGCALAGLDLTGYDDSYLRAARKYRAVVSALDAALAKNPDNRRLLVKKATFLTRNRAVDEGLQTIDRILAIEPAHRAALLLKAELLTASGQDEAAAKIVDGLKPGTPPKDALARQRIDMLVRAGRTREIPESWRDFEGLDAGQADFSALTLDGAIFRNAQLPGAAFWSTHLRDADFAYANLDKAEFGEADLTGASLMGAKLVSAIPGQQFAGANLQGVDLEGATGRPDFSQSDLRGALLFSVDFEHASFNGAKMAGAVLTGSRLLQGYFPSVDLTNADLSFAVLDGAYFNDASMRGANLTGASFLAFGGRPADLRGADLTDAVLDGTVFTSAIYDCKTRWPAGFDPGARGLINYDDNACGTKADFSWLREPLSANQPQRVGLDEPPAGAPSFADQDLDAVSFRGAWLPTSNFVGADLKGADFARSMGEADVRGADLQGADLSFVDLTGWEIDGSTDVEGVKLRGARLALRQLADNGFGDEALQKMDMRGAIVLDGLYGLSEGTDAAALGIVFYDASSVQRRFPDYHLRGADLRGYNLERATLPIDLSGADLRGAILKSAILTDAKLTGANLAGACYEQHTKWPFGFDAVAAKVVHCGPWWRSFEGSNVQRRELPPPEMPVPNLPGEDFSEMNLSEAWLPGSNMDKATLVHTRLKDAKLAGASLRSADLTGATLRRAVLERADLTGASLRGTDLRQAWLIDAKLAGADLTGAVYDLTTAWPSGFDPVAAGAKMVTD